MTLLAQAALDLRQMLEGDFAVLVTVTNPQGLTAVLRGLQNDVGLTIDPQTGLGITGRRASVALSIAALQESGLGMPCAIASGVLKPWRVAFTAPTGTFLTFKVSEAMPDKHGVIVCLLEAYKP